MAAAKRVTYADKNQTQPYDAKKANGADYNNLKEVANDHADLIDGHTTAFTYAADHFGAGSPASTPASFGALLQWLLANGGTGTPPVIVAPGKVGLVTPTPGPGSMSLAFAPVSGATSYVAKYRAAGTGAYVTGATGSASPLVITGLAATSKDFTVTARNSAGDGPASDAVTATPGAAPVTGGVNIVAHGNSITYNPAGGPSSWPAQMAGRFVGDVDYYHAVTTVTPALQPTRDYRVVSCSIGGRTLQEMLDGFDAQVLPYYDPTARLNIYQPQEQVNELSHGTTGSAYLTILRALCQRAKDAGFVVIPLTGTPVTQTAGTGLDFNATSQAISNAIRNPAGNDPWSLCVDLSRNSRVGAYGTTINGQDNGYSSFSTDNYFDGTHPTNFVNKIIGQMDFDVVNFAANGVAIPDPAGYPEVAMVGPLITWINPNNVGTGTIDNTTGTVSSTTTTPQCGFGPRSQAFLSAGTGLRGKIQYTLTGQPGLFGGSHTDASSGNFSQMDCGLYPDNASLRLQNHAGLSGPIGSWTSADVFEFWVYPDRIEIYKNGSYAAPYAVSNEAVTFPFFAKVLIDGNVFGSKLSNCNMLVLP